MKISSAVNSAVCCFHHSLPLSSQLVSWVFRLEGDEFTVEAFQCQHPDCAAHYSPWRGYFGARIGEHPNFGNPMSVPQCRHECETIYMFLTWKNDVLVWACPIDGCNITSPYNAGRTGKEP
jgi:hypothetical protein